MIYESLLVICHFVSLSRGSRARFTQKPFFSGKNRPLKLAYILEKSDSKKNCQIETTTNIRVQLSCLGSIKLNWRLTSTYLDHSVTSMIPIVVSRNVRRCLVLTTDLTSFIQNPTFRTENNLASFDEGMQRL